MHLNPLTNQFTDEKQNQIFWLLWIFHFPFIWKSATLTDRISYLFLGYIILIYSIDVILTYL